ncbi:mechanosensitive ion channel domain-containing protein [Phenylobacterium sp.]|jgi:miniconductance mechanosensitive channel|uniref:mechanosensitive ion channel family protein n=1 Tax=Phenylobacterium sp. TaxID=1871053 RepID=UPI000C975CB5|nr:mechanosensitive ion channel domain-containing protein [Phenylobacterium sp.]MAK81683.1 mechanosensitive ion channel protein MscS [Phenylobacterium sp.]|tara:strand:+ start:63082 stop:64329 length:1248 start_codon:yes stop_codon:yes gene_type:complete
MLELDQALAGLNDYPYLQTLIGLALLAALAVVVNWLTQHVLLRIVRRALSLSLKDEAELFFREVIARLANVAPAIVVYQAVLVVPHLPEAAETVVRNVAAAFMILTVILAITGALNLFNALYSRRPESRQRPIKGYIQVGKIVLYAAAAILVVATLLDRSPLLLISGLGAMAAVLLLVFKDTILSLVASVQLTSNDMIRVGDWIEMPQLNANGDVIDLALHTVKIQNFDKTITTIPTWRLINESFVNWRGMQESGGRRIMRAILLDQTAIRFLTPEEREGLKRFALLDVYLGQKDKELEAWNESLVKSGRDPVNTRRLTNVGTFRAYVQAYLKVHPGIAKEKTLMVRQRDPTPEGLPLEIYAFANTVVWEDYEAIQSDIFDHVLSILPEFDLRLFQAPTGRDMRGLTEKIGGEAR